MEYGKIDLLFYVYDNINDIIPAVSSGALVSVNNNTGPRDFITIISYEAGITNNNNIVNALPGNNYIMIIDTDNSCKHSKVVNSKNRYEILPLNENMYYIKNRERDDRSLDNRKYLNYIFTKIIELSSNENMINYTIRFLIKENDFSIFCENYNFIIPYVGLSFYKFYLKKKIENSGNIIVIYNDEKFENIYNEYYREFKAMIMHIKEINRVLTIIDFSDLQQQYITFNLCNYKLILKMIDNIRNDPDFNNNQEENDNINLDFYIQSNLTNDPNPIPNRAKIKNSDFIVVYKYFNYIYKYFEDNYIIYSLGASPEKLNNLWNLKNHDRQIKSIPFSGNAIFHPNDQGGGSREQINSAPIIKGISPRANDIAYVILRDNTEIEVDNNIINLSVNSKEMLLMIDSFENLRRNNFEFDNLINDLNNNRNVLITDFMSRGKSLYTLLILLQTKNVNLTNLTFLYLTEHVYGDNEVILIQNAIRYNFELFNINFDYKKILIIKNTSLDSSQHQNSELTNSRCIPKYKQSSWGRQLDDVYENNYFNCNVHTILYYMINSCFYDNFVVNNYNAEHVDTELSRLIDDFINNTTKNNIMNDFRKKYLKYKSKYIKLKNKIN